MHEIFIKKLADDGVIPTRQTENSTGYDIYSSETVTIPAGKFIAVHTGISIEMSPNIDCQVRPRSGLAFNSGITVLNSPGTIDPDYRGEIKVALINHSDVDYIVRKGDRIAQFIFSEVAQTTLVEVSQLTETFRGAGGFGSTGI